MGNILIMDMDNTLYNFVDYYAPAFRSMIHVLSYYYNIKEDILYDEFKKIFTNVGTLDYQYLVSSLTLSKKLSKDELQNLITKVRRAWDKTKAKRLIPYPYTIETIERLYYGGVKVIILTNAPYYHAYMRLRDMKLLKYVHGFVSWKGNYPIKEESTEKYLRVKNKIYENFELSHFLKRCELKPSKEPFLKILDYYGKDNNYYALGDSMQKDLYPAHKLNMITIWARYGEKVEKKNIETLLKITPWSESEIYCHYKKEFICDYEIDSIRELLEIIPYKKMYIHQLDMFD